MAWRISSHSRRSRVNQFAEKKAFHAELEPGSATALMQRYVFPEPSGKSEIVAGSQHGVLTVHRRAIFVSLECIIEPDSGDLGEKFGRFRGVHRKGCAFGLAKGKVPVGFLSVVRIMKILCKDIQQCDDTH